MTPLLRDLKLTPRTEGNEWWNSIRLQLGSGKHLIVQRATGHWKFDRVHKDYIGRWWIMFRDDELQFYTEHHTQMEELEAQSVFDHYVQTYGLLEEVKPCNHQTSEPASHPTR